MTEFSLGLTGDINDIANAHNLAMVALTARMQHERNYGDEQLAKLSKMRRLDVDPTRVEMGWVLDFCAQALRDIVIGMGGKQDGYMMKSKFEFCDYLDDLKADSPVPVKADENGQFPVPIPGQWKEV